MLVYVALLSGCAFLYLGGEWLLKGVTTMGYKLGWPKAITGLLLVSLGTSAPEFFVSLSSALEGLGAIAAGNVVGSNIINIAIVLALAISVSVIHVERLLQMQLLAMLVLSIVSGFMLIDGSITRLEGLGLMGMTAVSFAMAFRRGHAAMAIAPKIANVDARSTLSAVFFTLVGIVALLVGAQALIWAGLSLATQFGLPETVIALTVTAIGTGLPEIAATVVAVIRRENALALGNIIGSNLLNLGLVLGLSAVVMPLHDIDLSTPAISFFVALALIICLLGWKPGYYPRLLGPLLIASYIGYVFMLIHFN